MSIEKRLRPRITTDMELIVQHSGKYEWSSLRNLSGGGVFIETDNPRPPDSTLSMQIRLPGDSETLDIEGRVIWIKQGSKASAAGMGIEFTKISAEHQDKITFFVESCLREMREMREGHA